MLSEEGACLSSSQQPPLKQTITNFQKKGMDQSKKTATQREEM